MGLGLPARKCTILRLGEKMEKWVIGRILLYRKVNKINLRVSSLLKPTFHYSTIPLFHVRGRNSGPEKLLYSQ